MISAQIGVPDLLKLKSLGEASSYAENLVNSETLKAEFEGGVIRRKAFCEALEIGESTLSTWLQTDRIPRTATLAYVLWLAIKKQGNELRLRDQLATEPYVVHCGDTYLVVQPTNEPDRETVGQVIGRFDTVERAREYAAVRSMTFRRVLDQAINALWEYEEGIAQSEGEDNWVADAVMQLERARDFKVGPVTLDELA